MSNGLRSGPAAAGCLTQQEVCIGAIIEVFAVRHIFTDMMDSTGIKHQYCNAAMSYNAMRVEVEDDVERSSRGWQLVIHM